MIQYISGLARQRNWHFTSGINHVGVERTDFACEPDAAANGGLITTLHNISELEFIGNDFHRRTAIERRLAKLALLKGRTGTLVLDQDTEREQRFERMQLTAVKANVHTLPGMIDYDLQFTSATPYHYARGLKLITPDGAQTLNLKTDTFVVKFDSPDRDVYVEVWRGPFVRISGAPRYEVIALTGIRSTSTARTPQARRAKIESIVRELLKLRGYPWQISIDGKLVETAYLREVSAGDLQMPDALTYDLKFQTGIVEG